MIFGLSRSASLAMFALTFGVTGLGSAHADVPVLDEGLIKAPCAEARVLDECPTCTCQFITSTSSINAESSSNVPYGLVMKLEGKRKGDVDYAAIHLVMGDEKALTHLGRLAESYYEREGEDIEIFRQFDVTAMTQVYHMCPGDCDWNPVGLIHPFELKVEHRSQNITAFEETITEQKMLVLCFEQERKPVCYGTPIGVEVKTQTVQGSPFDKVKVKSKEAFKRTWKLGFEGELKLGAASGKLSNLLKNPKAVSVKVSELATFPDASVVR